jgi:predicted DCC family thiol-disulfide oxidoreductase YuxK
MYGMPALVLTQHMQDMEPEARSVFGGWKETTPAEWFALVMTNPVVRVTANFIFRFSKTTRRRIFGTEAEAIRWLDERARESGAK